MPHQHKAKGDFMRAAMETAAYTVKVWGTGAIGPALVSAFYGDEPWTTARALAEHLHLSDAQVRRRLNDLVELGRVERRDAGGVFEYRAAPEWAERTYEAIHSFALQSATGG